MIAIASPVHAQLATLDKGHQLLVNQGLQIWGLQTDTAYALDYNEMTAANMNAVMWSFGQSNAGTLSVGQKWGKWIQPNPTQSNYTSPANSLSPTETAHIADLVAIQVGDEQQSDIENPNGYTKAWFDAAHAGNLYPDQLLYVNSFFINDGAAYSNFIASANPDAISWDGYPFANPHGNYILPKNWLTLANTFRRYGLGSYIGATGASARPYGMYLQTFHDTYAVDPGEAQIRWQQFAAWTLGYQFADAFIYRGGNNNFGGQPDGPVYQAFQETARQGQNLGPALTKLISYGYGPSFVQGAGSSGMPGDWLAFDRNNAQASQRYLTAVSNVTNLGTKNGGLSGDVYVGFFNPLHLSFGDPTGTTYFMVMNGLGGDLTLPNGQSDNTATATQTRQQITLDFDFGVTGINSLLRLNRNTGTVDTINTSYNDGGNTVFTSLGNGKYQLQLRIDGGTGDLFKYNDGTAFVGVQPGAALGYWDSDANAANNDVVSGAGLGGSGTWNSGTRWHDGSNNSAFVAGSNVVFAGTPGTVTLSSSQAVSSLQFKSTGYVISGSSLILNAPTITTDAGVTATISSIVGGVGLIKNGAGTLNLTNNPAVNGNVTINEGVLGIGPWGVPGFPTQDIQINHGATLRFNSTGSGLPPFQRLVLGSGGGVIDTNGIDRGIYSTISGSTLTKIGAGALRLTGTNSHASTTIAGGSLVVGADANLGAAPATFTPGNITLDGGTLKFESSFDINGNRGITINAGGGTIDTQGFSNPSGYNASQGGFRGAGDLTKVGAGTFFAAATSGGANTSWKGRLIIKEGTWKIVASDGLPYNVASADPLQPAQVTLDGGTWQIGATMNVTNAKRGITVAAGGGTIDTQNFNLTWAGPMAGTDPNAVLTKTGSGQLQLNSTGLAPGSFAGTLNITNGNVVLNGGTAMGDLASISLANAAGATLTVTNATNSEVIGSLSGGGELGGTLSLMNSLTVGANNNSTTFDGQIIGGSVLRKSGSGTFTLGRAAGNTYTGATVVTGGKLFVNNVTGSGTGTGPVSISAGASIGGTGKISGTVMLGNEGHIAPGVSIGTLTVGSLSMFPNYYLDIELDTVAGIDVSDTIDVTTLNGLSFSTGGKLNVIDAGNMTGGIYTLIDYVGTFNGSLNNVAIGTAPAGFTYRLFNDAASTSVRLEVTAPGDFNHDGLVDGGDYVVWRKGLGTRYAAADYTVWQAHFGQTYGAGGGAGLNAVPEPATWATLCFCCICILAGNRQSVTRRD